MRGEGQSRRHALLGGDELDIGPQPAPQRIHGRGLALQLLRQIAELLDLAPVDRLEQSFAGGEVAVQRADADTGLSCDRFEARVRAAGAEDDLCRFENALPVANGISARPSRGSGEPIGHEFGFLVLGHLKSGGRLRINIATGAADR